jgi:hypothetical protein
MKTVVIFTIVKNVIKRWLIIIHVKNVEKWKHKDTCYGNVVRPKIFEKY